MRFPLKMAENLSVEEITCQKSVTDSNIFGPSKLKTLITNLTGSKLSESGQCKSRIIDKQYGSIQQIQHDG